MTPLICTRCGAPLPSTEPVPCAFCGVLHGRASGAVNAEVVDPAALASLRTHCLQAFQAEPGGPEARLRAAAMAWLPGDDAETLAKVVLALARDFEAEQRVSITADPLAMARLLEGYLALTDEMARDGSAVLSLPFLVASANGPVHFERRLDPATLAALAARPTAARKKGWWPFG